MTFCSRFLEDIEMKLDWPMRHERSVVNEPPTGSNILGSIDYSKKGCKLHHLTKSEMLPMRHYIINHCNASLSFLMWPSKLKDANRSKALLSIWYIQSIAELKYMLIGAKDNCRSSTFKA
jgi:hypothetical protein